MPSGVSGVKVPQFTNGKTRPRSLDNLFTVPEDPALWTHCGLFLGPQGYWQPPRHAGDLPAHLSLSILFICPPLYFCVRLYFSRKKASHHSTPSFNFLSFLNSYRVNYLAFSSYPSLNRHLAFSRYPSLNRH